MGISSCERERDWSLLEVMFVMGMSSGWLFELRMIPRGRLFPELMVMTGLIVDDLFGFTARLWWYSVQKADSGNDFQMMS